MAFGRLESSVRSRAAGARALSDINMTPLIDVILVLLVIFMITAPLLASRLQLDLPAVDGAAAADAAEFVAVAIDAQGRLHLGDEPLDEAALQARLEAAAKRNPRLEVQLRADRTLPYGRVAELIGLVQKAGLSRVGFVTEPGSVRGDATKP